MAKRRWMDVAGRSVWRFVASLRKQTNRQARLRRGLLVSVRQYFEILECRLVLSGTPVIIEFLASNSGGRQDADGDSSDWLEIYNPGTTDINLAGWTLTDTASDLNQWTFPSVTLAANQFLTVFASGEKPNSWPRTAYQFQTLSCR